MPPKQKDLTPAEDTSPYGLLITVLVKGANLLKAEVTDPAAVLKQTHISIVWPITQAVVNSEPVLPTPEGPYQYNFSKHCRRDPSIETLEAFLNAPIAITVHDSATGAPLGKFNVDFTPFALGEQRVENESAALDIHDIATSKILPGSYLSYEVQLHERKPDANAPVVEAPPKTPETKPLSGRKGAAAVPAVEVILSEPLPYTFLPPDVARLCNVVKLSLQPAEPLPSGLAALAEAQAGKLTFSCGMALMDGLVLACSGGVVRDGVISWPGPCKRFLTAEAAQKLRFRLEQQQAIGLELARYLAADNAADNAWDYYHSSADLNVWSELLTPGALTASTSASGWSACVATPQSPSCLPAYTPPSKSKSVEEMPAASPNSAAPASAWEVSGTRLQVTLSLARPIVPPWAPPTPPAKPLKELIPPRDLTVKPPPTTATDEFKAQIQVVARALAEEYMRSFPEEVLPTAVTSAEAAAARHRSLVFDLNRSGRYLQLKDSLKKAVVSIVREKYRKSDGMSPNVLGPLYADLYAHLLAALHSVLATLADDTPKPHVAAVPQVPELARLLALAQEGEVAGQVKRAEALHQRRLLADTDAQVWYDYATFCIRTGSLVRAEEALHASVELAQEHTPALFALASVLLHRGVEEDPLHLETADSVAAELRRIAPSDASVWALSSLVFRQAERTSDLEVCMEELRHRGRAAQEEGLGPLVCNSFYAAAVKLAELGLHSRALKALELVPDLVPWGEQITGEASLLAAQCYLAQGCTEEVDRAMQAAARGLPHDRHDVRLAIVQGKQQLQKGDPLKAAMYFQDALDRNPDFCTLDVYLSLAKCYELRSEYAYVRDVYAAAAVALPCCTAWLGAGKAALALGDLSSADAALSEANVCDNENAYAWGYLALVALRQGSPVEAEQALSYGIKAGLAGGSESASIFAQLAEQYLTMGRAKDAAAVATKLITFDDSSRAQILLGRALMEDGQTEGARSAFEGALARANGDSSVIDEAERYLQAV